MMDSPFCSGHIRLIDETILIIGGDNVGEQAGFGDGRYSVRVFTPGANPNYVTTDTMQHYFSPAIDPNSGARWYPTLLTMIDGNVLIASGATTDGTASLPFGSDAIPYMLADFDRCDAKNAVHPAPNDPHCFF